MNNYFYFNECVGNGHNLQSLCSALENTIIQFTKLKDRSCNKLIFEKDINKISLSGNSLEEIIKSSENKDYKKLIYSFLKNYPISSFFDSHQNVDEDKILYEQYKFLEQDATNLAIASECGWIAFSIPTSKELKVNQLKLIGNKGSLDLLNFYGDNIQFIDKSIDNVNYQKSEGVNKLKLLTKEVEIFPEFQRFFDEIPIRDQNLIIDRFEYAKNEQIILAEKIKANDKVVKHVKTRVGELRILNPIDIRVYFHSIGQDRLIIASMNYKNRYSSNSDQNKDIEAAEKRIEKFLNIK